ncbi:MAG: hypothetical protein ACI9KD_003082 [Congregibacter sp.]|jgi:hypothetical protein
MFPVSPFIVRLKASMAVSKLCSADISARDWSALATVSKALLEAVGKLTKSVSSTTLAGAGNYRNASVQCLLHRSLLIVLMGIGRSFRI